ncbi:MAG: ABC transporter substrate-binding protein [Pseudomonadota bacterium]
MKKTASLLAGLFISAAGMSSAAVAEPLKVAIVSRTVFFTPLWIAAERGFLKEEGIDAEIVLYDNAEKINEDLKSGKVQVAMGPPESVITDAYQGGSLRVVGGNAGKLPHFIITKPGIKTLAQLKGARIGVLSLQEGTTHVIREIASVAGLKATDYEIVAVGGAPTRWRLLKEGKIDVGLQPFPLSYEAVDAGFTNLGAVAGWIPDWQFTSVNADSNWAKSNPTLMAGFLRALRRGQDEIAASPDLAVAVASKQLQSSPALTRRALDETARLKILADDLSVSKAGMSRVFGSLVTAGALPDDARFDFDKVVDNTWLQMSRVPAARK